MLKLKPNKEARRDPGFFITDQAMLRLTDVATILAPPRRLSISGVFYLPLETEANRVDAKMNNFY